MRIWSKLVPVAIAAVAAACSGSQDPTSNVEEALRQADLPSVSVEWDDDANLARLTGSVASSVERDRAQQVAAAAVGTSGRVLNELAVKGIDEDVMEDLDEEIERNVRELIANDPTLRDRDIDLEVNNGAVLLRGSVRTAAEKVKVTEIVSRAAGVRDFANTLQIDAGR